jgi:hypothetical protein
MFREETTMVPDRSILDSKEKQVKKLAEKVQYSFPKLIQ